MPSTNAHEEYILETEHLALRNWKESDVNAAFAIYGDPRVTALQGRPPYANVEEARVRIAQQRALTEARGFGHWAMVERGAESALVGSCGFRVAEHARPLEIGFTVAPSRWGRGYGAEIVRACARYGIERLKAPRIVALTRPENVPSQRVLERAGMRPNGEAIDQGIVWKVYVFDAGE